MNSIQSTKPANAKIFVRAGIDFSSDDTITCKLFKNEIVRSTLKARIALTVRNSLKSRKILALNVSTVCNKAGRSHVMIDETTMKKSKLFQPDLKYARPHARIFRKHSLMYIPRNTESRILK